MSNTTKSVREPKSRILDRPILRVLVYQIRLEMNWGRNRSFDARGFWLLVVSRCVFETTGCRPHFCVFENRSLKNLGCFTFRSRTPVLTQTKRVRFSKEWQSYFTCPYVHDYYLLRITYPFTRSWLITDRRNQRATGHFLTRNPHKTGASGSQSNTKSTPAVRGNGKERWMKAPPEMESNWCMSVQKITFNKFHQTIRCSSIGRQLFAAMSESPSPTCGVTRIDLWDLCIHR